MEFVPSAPLDVTQVVDSRVYPAVYSVGNTLSFQLGTWIQETVYNTLSYVSYHCYPVLVILLAALTWNLVQEILHPRDELEFE